MGVIMENEEPLKKKRRKKKKRKKDMGNLFFNITQLAILCIFLGVCFIIFQTGYIQKIFQLHQEAQQIMETSTAADFQTDQQGEVYDKKGENNRRGLCSIWTLSIEWEEADKWFFCRYIWGQRNKCC